MSKKQPKQSRLKLDGLPVIDATSPIKLHIELVDIKGARKNDPAQCAAAKAIARTMKTDAKVFVSRTYVKAKDGKKWVRYMTPENVSREVIAFDRGSSFEPGEYQFPKPSKGNELGADRGRSYNNGPDSTPRPKRFIHTTAQVREWKAR